MERLRRNFAGSTVSIPVLVGKAGKGRFCPFWHNQKRPAAKSLSNPAKATAKRRGATRGYKHGERG